MKPLLRNDKGLSLVEVLVAITILLIIVIVFAALFNTSIRGIISSGDRSSTLFDLQKDLEAETPVPAILDTQPKNISFGNGVVIPGKQGTFKQDMADGNEVLIHVFIPE
jgi:prepilin-type N-terminal cleavage/methylation domain-containing protein